MSKSRNKVNETVFGIALCHYDVYLGNFCFFQAFSRLGRSAKIGERKNNSLCICYFPLFARDLSRFVSKVLKDLYGSANDPRTANDPRPQMIPRPEMIPKLDRKWSRTANDPRFGPQMIPSENEERHGWWDGVDRQLAYVNTDVFIKAIYK